MEQMELYFHIPFCVRKCFYCDFLSAPADQETQERYMEALLEETRVRAENCTHYEVISIFIGGGTPSLIEAHWIEAVMDTVRKYYHLAADAEITIECNPGTIDREKLECYYSAGINRLSIGLQSADDQELAEIGRIHTWQQFVENWQTAAEVGFRNLNVDLMSALPGQSVESYRSTLEKVLALEPGATHISAYSLIVEEGTCFGERAQRGDLVLPDEEEERRMYYDTARILQQAGYQRYEISNYALPGYECRHNCGYWKRIPYLGIGLGAASFMDNTRFNNTRDLKLYIQSLKDLQRTQGLSESNRLRNIQALSDIQENLQILNKEEQMEEFMFLGLRLTAGVRERDFQETYGCTLEEVYEDVIADNIRDELLSWQGDTNRSLILTERGLDLSNYVMAQFLLE